MASRSRLAQAATDLITWINIKEVNPSTLAELCTPDIAVPLPYPGSTPDMAGLVAVTNKIHGAAPDWKMSLQTMVVDQTEGRVVCLCRSQGTQEGYTPFPQVSIRGLIVGSGLGCRPRGRNLTRKGL